MTTPYTLPEPASEQAAFEDWATQECPSGDVTEVERKWKESSEYFCFLDSIQYPADQMQAAFAAGTASRDGEIAQLEQDYSAKCNELELVHSECEALRADAAKWREHVKPKIVGWMNPCNGVVISPSKKLSRSIGHGYPNFSVPVFAAIAAEGGKT